MAYQARMTIIIPAKDVDTVDAKVTEMGYEVESVEIVRERRKRGRPTLADIGAIQAPEDRSGYKG